MKSQKHGRSNLVQPKSPRISFPEKGSDEMKNYQTNPSLIFRFAYEYSGLLTFVIGRQKKRTHLAHSPTEHSCALFASLLLPVRHSLGDGGCVKSPLPTLKDCKPPAHWFNHLTRLTI
jgi:hypothetical protein